MCSLVAGRHDFWREIQAIDREGGAKIGTIRRTFGFPPGPAIFKCAFLIIKIY